MSTNNSSIDSKMVQQLTEEAVTIGNSPLPDSSLLAMMASTYFPEFSIPKMQEEYSAPEEIVRQPVQQGQELSELDFVKAIPVLLQEFDGRRCPMKYSHSLPFSFLEEVRSIFTPIDTTLITSETPASFQPVLAPAVDLSTHEFDVQKFRKDFPILAEQVNGKKLIWFDNAATTHKPKQVIERLSYFYEHENSNIHRGAHTLAARATDAYEEARDIVSKFLHASSPKEIVFVRGATEAINLVAQSWGKANLQKDDEIIISCLEHHANIVPWQMITAITGAKLRIIPVDESGQLLLDAFGSILSSKTKLVAVTHVSNALGTIAPVAQIVQMAHRYGAKVLIDGAQAVSHLKVDVQALDCDFYVFSGHKIFAPTGIGVLYGKDEVLQAMSPYQGGGNMIADVTFEKTLYQAPPERFEAGTANIADAVGLGAALTYVTSIGIENITRYEQNLLAYGMEVLKKIPGLRLIGRAKEKASVLSFVIEGFSNQEIGKILSEEGIAVRAGHHCAQPILRRFGLEGTVRPSLAFYNTYEEIDSLAGVLWQLVKRRNMD